MPAEDSVLRLTLAVEGLPALKTTMNDAAATVEKSGERMDAGFRASGESLTQLSTDFKKAANTGIMGFEAVQQQVIDLTKRSAELRHAMLSSSDPTERKRLNEELRLTQQRLEASRYELRGLTYDTSEATEKAQLLAGQFGVVLPSDITRLMARLPLLQAAMEAAFPILVVTAFLSLLREVPGAIANATDAIMGFGEKEKKAYDDAIQDNLRLLEATVDTHAQLRDLRELGAAPIEKLHIQSQNLTANLQEIGRETGNLIRAQTAQRAEIEKLTTGWGLWGTAATGWLDGTDQRVKTLQSSIENEEKLIQKWAEQMRALREIGAPKLKAETDEASREEARATAAARLDAIRSERLAELDLSKSAAQAMYDANAISLQEELALFRSIENQKYEAEREYLEGRLRLARTRAEREQATGALKVLDTTHRGALADIKNQEAAENRRIAAERIAAERQVVDTHIAGERQWISESLSLRRISIDQATAMEREAENERYTAARKALIDQAALDKTDTAVLNKQLEALELDHQNKLNEIAAQGNQRRIDDARNHLEQQISLTTVTANREYRAVQENDDLRLRMHQVTIREWESSEMAAIERWYEEQRRVLQEAVDFARRTYGENSLEYAKMLDRMNELDEKRADETRRVNQQVLDCYQRAFDQVNATMNRTMLSMLAGQMRFKEGVASIWDDLVSQVLSYIINLALEQAEQWITANILHLALKQQEVAQDAAAAAAQHTIRSTENVGAVTSEAAVAAATAYAAYAAIPPVAAAMAAEAFGATMAYAPIAAYEKGGIVPETDIALLHRNEMVLDSRISEGLQNMIAEGRYSSGPNRSILHYAPTINAIDRHGIAEVLEQHADILSRVVNGEVRAGRIRVP